MELVIHFKELITTTKEFKVNLFSLKNKVIRVKNKVVSMSSMKDNTFIKEDLMITMSLTAQEN